MDRDWQSLFGSGPVVLDGGLSTQLESHGHDMNHRLWTGRVLLEDPAAISRAHSDYVDSGADVVISASYQVSRQGFVDAGLTEEAADAALVSSVDAARAAVAGRQARVAASVGPYGAILHDGSEYRGRYGLSSDALVAFHRERVGILVDAGPDLLAVETIPDVVEAKAIVEVLADHPTMPVWMTFTAADDKHICAGQRIEDAVAVAASAPSVMAVGVNCTDPRLVAPLILRMRAASDLPIVIYPNAGGAWNPEDGSWDDSITGPFAPALVEVWQQAGATAIGGCCGTDASVIRDLAAQVKG